MADQPPTENVVTSERFTIRPEDRTNETRAEILSGPDTETVCDRHLMLLHGWGSEPSAMQRWFDAIKASGAFADRYVWNLHYDYRKPFQVGAAALIQGLQNQAQAGHRFNNVLLLGYSMGGVVARQMVTQGFPVTRLVSVCSPQQGLMYGDFFPPADDGVVSIKENSDALRALNGDPREASLRNRYLFIAVQYEHKNLLGQTSFQDDDTVVNGSSARGDALGPYVRRHNVRLAYEGGVAVRIGEPHQEGMDPALFGPALDFLRGR